ncbi:hypothetical protein [Endozoicomonas montiporae]|uniref:Uncharacterized protein n=1 Tax=Endozoicomonas montiporae CL-33 TaxID=570277 RepID=A0A142BB09_9GAMM|nr:hypothetical protein [Endozoicomonas montiporae]AMO55935.1 hypothetical protein EZMO1_1790 [Endozoicomonas montiporae CL-33]
MSKYQLSLVFFTILCQWSVGAVLAVTIYRSLPGVNKHQWNAKTVVALI